MSKPQKMLHIPGYRIERELGSGAMATAYLAIQESLEREVALKIMAPALVADQTFHERFLSEGKIIARLNHPNIVNVYDIGITDQAIYYMTLEYAREGNLTERMRKGLTVEESLRVFRQLANALNYAHVRNVVHRDVKPENVLFRTDETALLSDFGIAKALDSLSEMTAAGWVIGTPAYMSPEQAAGQRVGPQSDLYSLGIVFYEMLTGRRPHKSEDFYTSGLPRARQLVPQLPSELAKFQHIVDQLLAPNPLRRYSSAKELIREVAALEHRLDLLTGPHETRHKTSANPAAVLPEADIPPTAYSAESSREDRGARSKGLDRWWPIPVFSGLKWLLALLTVVAISTGIYWASKPRSPEKTADLQQVVRIGGPTYYTREKGRYLRELTATYQQILELEPENKAATEGLRRVADRYAALTEASWKKLDYSLSIELIYEGLRAVPDHEGLLDLQEKIMNVRVPGTDAENDRRVVWQWIREADEHLAESRFIIPKVNNAVASYRQVLQVHPHNEIAQLRLDDMASVFQRLAQSYLDRNEIESAVSYIEQGLFVSPNNRGLLALRRRVEERAD